MLLQQEGEKIQIKYKKKKEKKIFCERATNSVLRNEYHGDEDGRKLSHTQKKVFVSFIFHEPRAFEPGEAKI